MTTETEHRITDIETAALARWLRRTLLRARGGVAATPTGDTVERIRTRVFGEEARRQKPRSIAA